MIETHAETPPVRNAERIHVSDGSQGYIIVKLGTTTSVEFNVEASAMLNHAEARLLRRRLKAALKGKPRPDEVM